MKFCHGIFIAVLLVGILTGCGIATEQQQSVTPTPLPTPVLASRPRYPVQSGAVVRTLETVGRVAAVREQGLYFRRDGFVSEIAATAGEQVEAGSLLAALDMAELEGSLAQAGLALKRAETVLQQARADHTDSVAEAVLELSQAEAALQRARAGSSDGGVTAADVSVRRAEQALAYWQEELAKAEDRPWEPAEELARYAHEVEQAEQNLEVARAQYHSAVGQRSTGYYDVQSREVDVALAELALAQLERGVDPLLALDVEQARLELAELEARLADAQLVAPFAGHVLRFNIQPGEAVTAYDQVALLADPAQLELTLEVGADELAELGVGMTATVRLRSRPEAALIGSIRQLPTALGSRVGDDQRVHIALPEEVDLEIGEIAVVTIVLEERHNVLWLPPAAIRSFQGREFVVIEEAEGQRRVDIRQGIGNKEQIEILDGLQEGQIVVGE